MTNDNFDIREWRMKQLLNEAQFDPKKSDLNKDGKLSDYEKKRGQAIAKNMKEAVPFKKNALGEQPVKMYHDAEDLEEDDWKQGDDESDMAHSQLYAVKDLATKLCSMIDDGEQLDAWVQAKLTKAEDYLNSVYRYLAGEEREHDREDDDDYESMDRDVIVGASFYEGRGDTDYKRAKAAKRFGKKGEQNTYGAGVKKGEEIEKKRLRK